MAGRGGYRPGAGRKPGKVSQARRDLTEAAKEHADAALQVLVDVAGDETQTGSARIAAATAILDRGYGRPAQAVALSSPDGGLRPTLNPDELAKELAARGLPTRIFEFEE